VSSAVIFVEIWKHLNSLANYSCGQTNLNSCFTSIFPALSGPGGGNFFNYIAFQKYQ